MLLVVLFASALSSPSVTKASIFTDFGGKVKGLFLGDKQEESEDVALTSQTMSLIKPMVIDEATTSSDEENSSKESLDAISGPLRFSTEEIDFPTTDTISVYEVKAGDTLPDVAKLFDVSVNTIVWANNLKSRSIAKGDTLVILPITGIKHVVKKGDTIASIAKKYKADKDDIAQYNGLAVESALTTGGTVIVPDGEIQATQVTVTRKSSKSKILNRYAYTAPSGFLVRPVIGGRKTQGIHGHNGVDIAATPGTPVLASASGRVIVAKMGGYNGGYGSMIILSHEKGIQTVYAHLQNIYVNQGQTVSQGTTIGEVGNTGRSTGPHLHFEVRGAKNPF